MTNERNKRKSQTSCPLKTNSEDKLIEELESHTPKISEIRTTREKKQIHQAVEGIR